MSETGKRIGPPCERVHENERAPAGPFAAAVASCADGELLMPEPFDHSSSTALANNDDTGAAAESLFKGYRGLAARDRRFRVRVMVHEVAPEGSDIPDREVIDTILMDPRLALPLIADFIGEVMRQGHHDEDAE